MTLRALIMMSLILSSLPGCMVPERTQPHGRVGIMLPEPDYDLEQLEAPEQLGDFRYLGSMSANTHQFRVLRYQHHDNPQQQLEVALYLLPGGWDDLSTDRVIDGHFVHVREEAFGKLGRRSNSPVREIQHDNLIDDSLDYPIAVTELRSTRGASVLADIVLLTVEQPLFIRVRLETSHALDETGPTGDELIAEGTTLLLAFRNSLSTSHAGN